MPALQLRDHRLLRVGPKAVTVREIVRDVRRRQASATAGCADAKLVLDEVLRRLPKTSKKRNKRR